MVTLVSCSVTPRQSAARVARRLRVAACLALVVVVSAGCGSEVNSETVRGDGQGGATLATPEITRLEVVETWLAEPGWEELGPDEPPPTADALWHEEFDAWVESDEYLEIEWTEVDGAEEYALYVDGELRWTTRRSELSFPRRRAPGTGDLRVVAYVWADGPTLNLPELEDPIKHDLARWSLPSTPEALPE